MILAAVIVAVLAGGLTYLKSYKAYQASVNVPVTEAVEKIELTEDGPILYVAGIDLRDGTPIYDIKPYLAYVDCHTDATDGFAFDVKEYELEVEFPNE